MRIRGFEFVAVYQDKGLSLPIRSTQSAAGYDIAAVEDIVLAPSEIALIPTGLKAYMQEKEVLYLFDRSSNPRKKGLVLINSVGVIDRDYYNNAENEGHIFVQMKNILQSPVTITAGERIAQGIFMPYLLADGDTDTTGETRTGGFGSTGK